MQVQIWPTFTAPFLARQQRWRWSARCTQIFCIPPIIGQKVDIIILAAAWRGSRVVNHTSYTFTAAGTQRRLARVQLDLRRVRRERETFVCLFSYARRISLPALTTHGSRRSEGISRVQTRIYYVMHTAAASLVRSKPQQLLRACTVDTCSFSRVYPKPFSNGPLRAEYSFSLYICTWWEKGAAPICNVLLYRFSLAGPWSGMTRF
jgi:hypothetical protein